MDCMQCGASIPDSSKFCPECGARQEGKCATCGTVLAPTAKFCPECGTKVASASQTATSTTATSAPSLAPSPLGLAPCAVALKGLSAEGPDRDGDMTVTARYKVKNGTLTTWDLLAVRAHLLGSGGQVIATAEDTHEQPIDVGDDASFEANWWAERHLLGPDPGTASVVIEVLACARAEAELGSFPIPARPFAISRIQPAIVGDALRIVSGSIWKSEPDDDAECAAEVKLLVQNLTDQHLPVVHLSADILDSDEDQVADAGSQMDLAPSGVCLLAGYAHAGATAFDGATVRVAVQAFKPVATGSASETRAVSIEIKDPGADAGNDDDEDWDAEDIDDEEDSDSEYDGDDEEDSEEQRADAGQSASRPDPWIDNRPGFYLVTLHSAAGGEFAYGSVTEPDAIALIKEKIEEDDLGLDNNYAEADVDEEQEFDFRNANDVLHAYGPLAGDLWDMRVNLHLYSDPECSELIEELRHNERGRCLKEFRLQTSEGYFQEENSPEDLFFGGFYIEKRVCTSWVIEIGEKETFDSRHIWVLTVPLDDLFPCSDVLPLMMFYVRPRDADGILQSYYEGKLPTDLSEGDRHELLVEALTECSKYFYYRLWRDDGGASEAPKALRAEFEGNTAARRVCEILERCNCREHESAGKGEREEAYAVVKTMAGDTLFEGECRP